MKYLVANLEGNEAIFVFPRCHCSHLPPRLIPDLTRRKTL